MRRWLPLIALPVLASCNNIAAPTINSVYQYALVTSRSDGSVDTLIFHWPRSFLPVRVWVADTSVLKPYVPVAIERWQHAFLYGEYRAELVTDSMQADVIVISGYPQVPGFEARAPQCSGETDAPDPDTNTWQLPIHIYVYSNTASVDNVPGLDTCYSITITHELGHSIGLLVHSPFPTDVMFANPVADSVSVDDRETAETVYHVPATVVPVGRR